MPIAIVSRDAVLRDKLLHLCSERVFRTVSVHDVAAEIQSMTDGTVVLMHVTDTGRRVRWEIQNLRAKFAAVKIVLLTAVRLTDAIRGEFAAQVDAVVPEGQSADTLIGALAVVRDGYRLVYPETAANGRDRRSSDAPSNLSKRERMILRHLCEGGSNKDIANDLGICEATVKVHLRACFRKIGAKNRTQAAMWAIEKL
ncbi:helix-turn-helix transcriptional regulator [Actibacterium ureilyticum]|uniref:helix-turn-helix transcriptional regulator n=1 Tax=Actibacterium ureilyticum TaxID=1590614 RepID=UPI000BAABEB0|nr:response regulator transcription factor [Actibacterium ureilyticum]